MLQLQTVNPRGIISYGETKLLNDLKLSGIDRKGLVNEVTRMISNTKNVNINKINFDSEDQFFTGMIQLTVQNKTILDKLVMTLSKVNGIDKIVRE